jgi:hypothetical protein
MVLAGQLSAAQLAALARRLRRRSTADALAAHRRQRVEIVDIADGTGVHFEGELYDDAALALRAALDEYLRDVTKDPLTGRYPPVEHSQAEALIEMALAWLSGHERDADRPAIFVHADARLLSGDDGWAESAYGALAAETIRRMACYCHLSLTGEHDGPDPLRLGRSQRLPTWQQREMVRRRDGGCRFPGCRRNRWRPPTARGHRDDRRDLSPGSATSAGTVRAMGWTRRAAWGALPLMVCSGGPALPASTTVPGTTASPVP